MFVSGFQRVSTLLFAADAMLINKMSFSAGLNLFLSQESLIIRHVCSVKSHDFIHYLFLLNLHVEIFTTSRCSKTENLFSLLLFSFVLHAAWSFNLMSSLATNVFIPGSRYLLEAPDNNHSWREDVTPSVVSLTVTCDGRIHLLHHSLFTSSVITAFHHNLFLFHVTACSSFIYNITKEYCWECR